MTRPLLTAALIARDEERHLPDCLASLEGVVDEVVIVDTGSVDRSVAIARAHGARVFHSPWCNDFSAPRNVGLDQARGRWILCIDPDERLRPISRGHIEALLEGAEELAFLVHLRHFARATPSLEYRLWRNDARVRFSGVVHERVSDALREVAEAEVRSIGTCELTLDHLGLDGDQTHKHERNLPLLQAKLALEPTNVPYWVHLSRALRGLGRSEEGEQALGRAVALSFQTQPDDAGVACAELVSLRQQHGENVTARLARGRARWPWNWMLVWIEGQLHLEAAQFEQAIACFGRLLEVDTSRPQPVVYDERLFGSWAQDALGLALFRAERYREAADAYAAAEHLEPDVAEYRAKRRLAESRAGQGLPATTSP
jgi:glycosyltransferase involved in cell wall biosynthesis